MVALLVFAAPAFAEERVRARVAPDGPIYVGQRATFEIELLTTNFFRGAPDLPDVDLLGAIVRRESQFAVNASTEIDGEQYASQTWTFVIYPQRTGTYRVPPLDVVMRVPDDDGKLQEVSARTPEVAFEATVPDAAKGLPLVLSTPDFKLAYEAEPEPKGLKVGDALRRTFTMTIASAPGMLIPPLPEIALEGVAAYPDQPRVEEKAERGEITGTRVESVTYVFERAGTYAFPAVTIHWWDVDEERLETASIAAVTFDVEENPDAAVGTTHDDAASIPDAGGGFPWTTIGAIVLTALLGFLLWRHHGGDVRAWIAAREQERRESESAYFARFEKACETSNADAVLRAMTAWLECRAGDARNLTPTAFARAAGDAALIAEVAGLEAALYGARGGSWSGAALRAAAARAREARASDAASFVLLNPRRA